MKIVLIEASEKTSRMDLNALGSAYAGAANKAITGLPTRIAKTKPIPEGKAWAKLSALLSNGADSQEICGWILLWFRLYGGTAKGW